MNHLWLGVLVVGLILGYLLVSNFRFVQTLSLIVQTSPYEQSGTGQRVLIVGDSTGYGTGVTNPRASVAGRLGSDFPDLNIENRSVNGGTINDALQRVRGIEDSYEVVLLQLGGNDILQELDPAVSRQRLEELHTMLRDHTDHVIMMSAGNVGAAPAFTGEQAERLTARTLDFHAIMERFAAERPDFTYVNLYEPPTTDPFSLQPEVYLARDGLHPTAQGYAVWYQKLQPVMASLLREVR